MNSQLELHLETFDSDEEFSESPLLHEDEHIEPVTNQDGLMNPLSAAVLKGKAQLRKFVKPRSIREAIEKILWMLPVAIALGDYIGMILSTSLSIIAVVVMQLKPDPPPGFRFREQIIDEDGDYDGNRNRTVISNMQMVKHPDLLYQYYYHDDEEELCKALAQKKKQVQDCRKEVSRLLGLVGAPPLEWKRIETQRKRDLRINNVATVAIVKFLEAHVQFLLTVDQAYRYLQISTSLHLGLGPASQCVERVERAAIARDFRNKQQQPQRRRGRKQTIGASFIIRQGVGGTMEPQRPGKSPVLALASVKTNLAKSMVDQSESLIQVWKGVRNCTRSSTVTAATTAAATTLGAKKSDFVSSFSNNNNNTNDDVTTDDNTNTATTTTTTVPNMDNLHMPDVVDLSWIKLARQQLAGLISHIMDYFCTMDVLQTLSEGTGGARSRLEESTSNVRNAREHLLCSLLLGKQPAVKVLSDLNNFVNGDTTNLKLVQSLMQYRDQLDALKGAIWSCQHYSNIEPSSLPAEEERYAVQQQQWWSQIQQMSSTCRALEEEIGQEFFFQKMDNNENDGSDDDNNAGDATNNNDNNSAPNETGNYEHSGVLEESNTQSENNHQDDSTQTKTMVFKGKGAKEDRPTTTTTTTTSSKSNKHKNGIKTSDGGEPLPPRDTVSEQQMVKELKNRIATLCPPEDDDDKDEDLEDCDRNASAARQPSTSHFLGATGSLLSELKGSLPVMDKPEEEILGE